MELKTNQIAVAGRVTGKFNKETKSFDIKRGLTKKEEKYQIFSIAVSSKNQDGTYTNGMDLPVMMFGDKKIEHGETIGLVGSLVPNNYTNKDGKEVRGLQVMAYAKDMFVPTPWTKKEDVKPEAEQMVW